MAKNRAKELLAEIVNMGEVDPDLIAKSMFASPHARKSAERLMNFARLDMQKRSHLIYLLSIISDHLFEDWPRGRRFNSTVHISLLRKVQSFRDSGDFMNLTEILKSLLEADPEVKKLIEEREVRRYPKNRSKGTEEQRNFSALKTRFYRAVNLAKTGRLTNSDLTSSEIKSILRTLKPLMPRGVGTMNVKKKLARKKSGYYQP